MTSIACSAGSCCVDLAEDLSLRKMRGGSIREPEDLNILGWTSRLHQGFGEMAGFSGLMTGSTKSLKRIWLALKDD